MPPPTDAKNRQLSTASPPFAGHLLILITEPTAPCQITILTSILKWLIYPSLSPFYLTSLILGPTVQTNQQKPRHHLKVNDCVWSRTGWDDLAARSNYEMGPNFVGGPRLIWLVRWRQVSAREHRELYNAPDINVHVAEQREIKVAIVRSSLEIWTAGSRVPDEWYDVEMQLIFFII